jgi:hypothetical protein
MASMMNDPAMMQMMQQMMSGGGGMGGGKTKIALSITNIPLSKISHNFFHIFFYSYKQKLNNMIDSHKI